MTLALTTLATPLAAVYQLAASPALLVACYGYDNTYATSADGGQAWTARALPVAGFSQFLWDGAYFVGINGAIAYRSPDGINWTAGAAIPGVSGTCKALATGGGKLVACYDTALAVSSDHGATWAVNTPLAWCSWVAVAYDSALAKFVAMGTGTEGSFSHTVLWGAADGAAWANINNDVDPGGNQANIDHIHIIGSKYVASGNWPLMYSTDAGVTFHRGTLDRSYAAGVLNGEFIYCENIMGGAQTFYRSTDAIAWSAFTADGAPVPLPGLQGFTSDRFPDDAALYLTDGAALYKLATKVAAPSAFWTTLIGTTEIDLSTNALQKDTDTALIKGTTGTPGTPGSVAYTSYETTTVCQIYLDGASYAWVTPTDGGDPQYMMTSGGVGTASYRCVTSTKPVYHAAVAPTSGTPGTADATTQNFRLGWNAGARSIATLGGDGTVSFKIASSVGIAAGFNSRDLGTQYGELEHGLLFASGLVRVIEAGALAMSVGLFAVGDTFTIKRLHGEVSYWKGNALLYTSATPSSGTVFLDVSMYSGGDELTNPAFGSTGGANIVLRPLSALGGIANAGANLMLPKLHVASRWAQGAKVVLPALQLFAGKRSAEARIQLPALAVQGEGGYSVPAYAIGAIDLPRLQVSGRVLTGRIAHGNLKLPKLTARGSNRIYGEAHLTLPRLALWSNSFEGPLNATLGQFARAHAQLAASAQLSVVMRSNGEIAAVIACSAVLGATMDDGAHAEDAMSAQAILLALMQSGAVAIVTGSSSGGGGTRTGSDPSVEARESDWQIWSLDWDSGHGTAYENFGFNSFAHIGGSIFGAKPDGIYLLEGGDDAGAPIRASAHFGRQDFGTSAHKRVPNAYAGVSASGQLVLRVQVDGGPAYLYNARALDVAQKVARFDLGRGLKGTYYVFELYNEQGADFDLESIEFLPVALTRRI